MAKSPQHQLSVLLPNLRSVYNVGSIFRTADAVGVSQIYLSGYTPGPVDDFGRPRADLAKTALGAERTVPCLRLANPGPFIKRKIKAGYHIMAVEQAKQAIDFRQAVLSGPTLLILGEERTGIPQDLLSLSQQIVEIPMVGEKESLNVAVAFGLVAYQLLFPT